MIFNIVKELDHTKTEYSDNTFPLNSTNIIDE